MADILSVTPSVRIPVKELHVRTARSSGRGGQNVNKVETSVEILFDVKRSPSLSEEEKRLVLNRLATRIDSRGYLHAGASESRSQWQNRVKATQRLVLLLRWALKKRTPRIATRAHASSRERRIEEKKRRGKVKALRRVRPED